MALHAVCIYLWMWRSVFPSVEEREDENRRGHVENGCMCTTFCLVVKKGSSFGVFVVGGWGRGEQVFAVECGGRKDDAFLLFALQTERYEGNTSITRNENEERVACGSEGIVGLLNGICFQCGGSCVRAVGEVLRDAVEWHENRRGSKSTKLLVKTGGQWLRSRHKFGKRRRW